MKILTVRPRETTKAIEVTPDSVEEIIEYIKKHAMLTDAWRTAPEWTERYGWIITLRTHDYQSVASAGDHIVFDGGATAEVVRRRDFSDEYEIVEDEA